MAADAADHQTTKPPMRLPWQRTWHDKPRDFTARAGNEQVGRIHFAVGVGQIPDCWHWSCYGRYRGRFANTSGTAATKDEAARALEEAWFKAIEKIDRESDGITTAVTGVTTCQTEGLPDE